MENNSNQIRASYDDATITVYQAYNSAIADAAVKHQTFVPPFKMERMTWIKPSFLWMMYRCGWATKENQERVLAIKMKREGFEWCLANSCLSHFDAKRHGTHEAWKTKMAASPVRIQWDPEKDILLQPLPYRSIQIGISGDAVERYVKEWIVQIEDITPFCRELHRLIEGGRIDLAESMLPDEILYDLPEDLAQVIGAQV